MSNLHFYYFDTTFAYYLEMFLRSDFNVKKRFDWLSWALISSISSFIWVYTAMVFQNKRFDQNVIYEFDLMTNKTVLCCPSSI